MPRVSDLFTVEYGVNLELNALERDPSGVCFVARSAKNNGVTARVARLTDLEPIPAGTITVAGGGSVMESFLQPEPYYSGRDLYFLTARVPMSDAQKLYYCACLRANRYRYNYGRQANRTLREIELPEFTEIPGWVGAANLDMFVGRDRPAQVGSTALPSPDMLGLMAVGDLFDVGYGHSLELNRLVRTDPATGVPFVSRKSGDNGISAYVEPVEDMAPNPAGDLTVALSGNGVLSTFLQERPYYTAFHVACLRPKQRLSKWGLLYVATCIYANRYRFNYGRQANRTLALLQIPVPKTPAGWDAIDTMMQALPFSSQIS